MKEHLIGKNYEWPENRTIIERTTPDMQLFDHHNGDDLLFMINFFCTSVGTFSIKEGQKIEILIGQLPCEVKSELSVFNWLRGRYLYYWKNTQ